MNCQRGSISFFVAVAWVMVGLLNVDALAEEPTPQVFDRLTFHAAPKPLAAGARTSDWPRFLGPLENATSPETPLLKDFPETGPNKVWEVTRGEGYTSPVIVGDRLIVFHSLDGKETVECLHPETGQRYWIYDYPIQYQDRYGYANGPRGSPVIAADRVLTLGVSSQLHCLDLKTGKLVWKHDLAAEYKVPQEFFGHGSSPLVFDGKVIVNVGGKGEVIDGSESHSERCRKLATAGLCVGAFDLASGALVWSVVDGWGASYASPIVAELHGQKKILVFAGGESDPAIGGLLCIDPGTGKVHARFPWRADQYTSVNASTPVLIRDKNRVLITTAYPKGRPIGAVMLEFDDQFQVKEVWKSKKLACHWMNPVYHEGFLYAIDGETEALSRLVCYNADTGEEKWGEDVQWEDKVLSQRTGRPYTMKIFRASLLRVDGEFLCLGEFGSLLWLDLSPKGCTVLRRAQLFHAPHTWSLPSLSRGLLYVGQHERDIDERPARFVCYDLRGGD